MAEYIYAFHGGTMPENQEEVDAVMAKWGAWMQGLGAAIVNPGAPVGKSSTISATGVTDDGGPNPLSGYTIVRADSLEAAIKLAKGCPILENDGSIEVAEVVQM